jgi:hypothetical protein
MDKLLEILIVQYGFSCQTHEAVVRDSDQFSPHGAYDIKASSETMKDRFKAVEKYIEENYERK